MIKLRSKKSLMKKSSKHFKMSSSHAPMMKIVKSKIAGNNPMIASVVLNKSLSIIWDFQIATL